MAQDGKTVTIDGYTDYNPLPTGLLNGFTASDRGPGYHGGDATAIPGWYNDEVNTQLSLFLVYNGYARIENPELSLQGNRLRLSFTFSTDWRDFFNKMGVTFPNPGFPSTAPPPTVQHADACSNLKMAVAQF